MYFWERWLVIPSQNKIQRQKSHLQPASVLHDDSRSDHDDSAVPGSEKLPAGRRKQYLRTGRSGTDQPLCGYYSAGCSRSLAVFFMKQFFETLPDELAEAARVDGCSEFRIFWNIYLPLILPAAVALGIMTFQSGWNSFMWPMIVLNSRDMMTIQVGLSTFQYQYNTQYGPLMARHCDFRFTDLITFPVCTEILHSGYCFLRKQGLTALRAGFFIKDRSAKA